MLPPWPKVVGCCSAMIAVVAGHLHAVLLSKGSLNGVKEKFVISTSGALASFPFQIDSLWHAFLAQASTVRVSRGQRGHTSRAGATRECR